MSRIDDLIKEHCPDGVEFKSIEKACIVANNKRKPVKSSLRTSGTIPYYGANNIQDYVEGFTHEGNYVLIAEDGSASLDNYSIQYTEGKFWANNHVHVIKGSKELKNRFLFHYLRSMNFRPFLSGGERAKLTKAKLLEITIPIPPLPVQQEIVDILDAFTKLEAELEAELEARRQQYAHYRNSLLSFNEIGTNVERESCFVQWRSLGEIAKIKHGKDYKKLKSGNIPVYGSGGIMTYVDQYSYNKPTVLIPRKGTITNIFYTEEPFWNVDTIYYTDIDTDQISPKFFYYFMKTVDLISLDTGSGRPSLTMEILNKIQVPVPSLEEQEHIVAILDKFDALVNDISSGLPAEITARRKQYEHYRNQLLTFKEAV